MWKKIDEDNFEEREDRFRRRLKLSKLQAELQTLLDEPRPTLNELKNWAVENHPYFMGRKERIKQLKDLITELKAL